MILTLLLYSPTYIMKLHKPWEAEMQRASEVTTDEKQEKNKNIGIAFSRYNAKIVVLVLLKEGLSFVKNNTA